MRDGVTVGDPEEQVRPAVDQSGSRGDDAGTAAGLAPIGPGHPMAEIEHLAAGCDIRPDMATCGPRADGGPP